MLTSLSRVIEQLVNEPVGERFFKTALLYVKHGSDLTKIEVLAIFYNVSAKADQVVMTAYEEIIEEGVEKGEHRTNLRHIQGLLRIGMTPEAIAAAFEMPLEEVKAYIQQIQQQ